MPFPAVHPALDRALVNKGYAEPTPVQAAVLEVEYAERDLLVSAQTGSGKTVAFGLAAAPTLLGDKPIFGPGGAPLCLAIAPTRELAMQVAAELQWLYADSGAKIATCVGGMDARREARALGFGVHIVVGTPGRLKDQGERRFPPRLRPYSCIERHHSPGLRSDLGRARSFRRPPLSVCPGSLCPFPPSIPRSTAP